MRPILILAAVIAVACGPAPKPAPTAKSDSGSAVRILQFYASPGIVAKGESANLCYGTENVTKVRIEPPVETLAPALSRCIQVAPRATTTYKLIAEGAGGELRERTVEVIVSGIAVAARKETAPAGDPKLPRIIEFVARQNDVAPGTDVMFCFTVANANELKLFPGVAKIEGSKQGCFTVKANETRDYTLVAVGASNIVDRKSVTVRVK